MKIPMMDVRQHFVYHYTSDGRWSGGTVKATDMESAVVVLMADHPNIRTMTARITVPNKPSESMVFAATRINPRKVLVDRVS